MTCCRPRRELLPRAVRRRHNATVRTVFIVGPDKKIKLMLSYPMSTGRNFDEILRVLDSMQLTAKHKVATPVNWKDGDDVIILPACPRTKRNRSIRTAGSRRSRISGSSRSRSKASSARVPLFSVHW